jgi:transposase
VTAVHGQTGSDWDRMYTARTAHLVRRTHYGSRVSACGRFPWPNEWLGTGSQDEYERAAALPLCKLCEKETRP